MYFLSAQSQLITSPFLSYLSLSPSLHLFLHFIYASDPLFPLCLWMDSWPLLWFVPFYPYIEGYHTRLSGKESACQCRRCRRHGFSPWLGKIPWRRKWQPTPVSLAGKSHGQWNLADYGPWGHKESDMTEQLNITHSYNDRAKYLKHKTYNIIQFLILWFNGANLFYRYSLISIDLISGSSKNFLPF